MKALIIEDSRLARAELAELLKAHDNIDVCGEAENPQQAIPLIKKEHPDLLFLDINMPGMNGFELLEELDYDPKVIFITAYADYAIRSFEFDTVDYLLKPVSAERLKKSIEKLFVNETSTPTTDSQTRLQLTSKVLLRSGEQCHWVSLKDIIYFESCGNHTQVFWAKDKALIYRSLNKIESRLPEHDFFRANRQHIININDVVSVEPWINGGYQLRLKNGMTIEVSRRHSTRFKEIFSL